MTDARFGHPAVRLDDGRVLLVGGALAVGRGGYAALGHCELFHPGDASWEPTGTLASARKGHQATPLLGGGVLVTGGDMRGFRDEDWAYDPYSQWSTERYDPDAGTWSADADMPWGRSHHRAVRLRSGAVLVLGGTDDSSLAVGYQNAVLYDPGARVWSDEFPMGEGRWAPAALALPDGRVLVMGGLTHSGRRPRCRARTGSPPAPRRTRPDARGVAVRDLLAGGAGTAEPRRVRGAGGWATAGSSRSRRPPARPVRGSGHPEGRPCPRRGRRGAAARSPGLLLRVRPGTRRVDGDRPAGPGPADALPHRAPRRPRTRRRRHPRPPGLPPTNPRPCRVVRPRRRDLAGHDGDDRGPQRPLGDALGDGRVLVAGGQRPAPATTCSRWRPPRSSTRSTRPGSRRAP
ncbi:hypothetical protein O1L60_36360 [Streptomyces diastatochromogenes]|nr:hypothetical protein [Streptomyces diastatochromogenes]